MATLYDIYGAIPYNTRIKIHYPSARNSNKELTYVNLSQNLPEGLMKGYIHVIKNGNFGGLEIWLGFDKYNV